MGGCRSLWIVVGGCRSLWIIVGGCRLLWVIPYFSMYGCLVTSSGNLSLPYRMNSTNNSFERLEMTLGGKISLKPLRSSCLGSS